MLPPSPKASALKGRDPLDRDPATTVFAVGTCQWREMRPWKASVGAQEEGPTRGPLLPATRACLTPFVPHQSLLLMEGNPPFSIEVDRAAVDGLLDVSPPATAFLTEQLASIFGATALALLHYGSRAQGRVVRPDSAFDFFIVVTNYPEAYRAATFALGPRCRPRLAVVLARLLPPNAMSVRRSGPFGEQEAKCLIISERDFQRECSARARDHFVQARMAQRVLLTWARDLASAAAVLRCVRQARDRTFDWARVFLPPSFDLPGYGRTLIDVSFAHEIRAEAKGHGEVLFSAQRSLLSGIYEPLLARLAERGVLERHGDHYRQRRPPSAVTRVLVRSYFHRSKLRTTLRLLKHPFLYDNWLEYITRKIDRSTGQRIELTERERRRPLIFIWPRVVRYVRSRPQRGH